MEIFTHESMLMTEREKKDKERKRKVMGMGHKIRNGIKTANFSTPVMFEETSSSHLASSSSRALS